MQIDKSGGRQARVHTRPECVCLCVRAREGGPRLVSLIDLAQDLSDLQDNSKLKRCRLRWKDGKRDAQEERKRRKLKIDRARAVLGT